MRIFGLEITRATKALSPVYDNRGGWRSIIGEPFTGAWQRNLEIDTELVPSFHAVFACVSLIAGDVSKLWIKTQRLKDGVWLDEDKPSPKTQVLDAPNQFQNRNQFFENWMLSKLMRGNTYVLKRRDARGVVNRMWVLDPWRVKVLVSDSGDVFYELGEDNLTGRTVQITVPGSEIIHDRMNCFFHPLVGLSPLYAASLPAQQGLNIQGNSASFFGNRSIPGGILTAPTSIPDATAARLKREWNERYSGDGAGKTAVLGDGLKFEAMAVTAEDAQLLEQAKATAEWVCSAFHVPPYKIGAAPPPAQSNIEALNVQYYTDCIQRLLEDCETCLDRGLELGSTLGIEFDVDGLLRMDTVARITSLRDASSAGLISPNEGRAKLGYGPAKGGESPMVQQQFFSLAALAERDREKPFANPAAPAPAAPAAPAMPHGDDDEAAAKAFRAGKALAKELGMLEAA